MRIRTLTFIPSDSCPNDALPGSNAGRAFVVPSISRLVATRRNSRLSVLRNLSDARSPFTPNIERVGTSAKISMSKIARAQGAAIARNASSGVNFMMIVIVLAANYGSIKQDGGLCDLSGQGKPVPHPLTCRVDAKHGRRYRTEEGVH